MFILDRVSELFSVWLMKTTHLLSSYTYVYPFTRKVVYFLFDHLNANFHFTRRKNTYCSSFVLLNIHNVPDQTRK